MRYDALPVLQTERLLLRPVIMDDVPAVFAYAKDPEVSRLLAWEPSVSLGETKKVIAQWLQNYHDNKTAPWGIVDKTANKIIGTIDVRHYDRDKQSALVGYCLSRDYWGRGLMAEALQRVIEYLFTETDIIEIAATCRTDNPQSIRVLEKVGMHKQENQRERKSIKGALVDFDRYVIRKNEG